MAIVYVHPFGEEMNKARRMAAMQSRRFARAGYAVLQMDLYGCGDSSGDFADATWEIWKEDISLAVRYLRERVTAPVSLWGLRLGGTLAVDVSRDPGMAIDEILLWQPVLNGEQFLTQFLRLHLAGEMLSDGAAKTGVSELRESLARGSALEIAGYHLHPRLADSISAIRLPELVPVAKRAYWLEVSLNPDARLSPASSRVVENWRGTGVRVETQAVSGPPFWSTVEITDCTALLDATERLVGEKASLA